MLTPFDLIEHYRTCRSKQAERAQRIVSLPSIYRTPLTSSDNAILQRPIAELVQDVHDGSLQPLEILHTYGKAAVLAHKKTNCVTEMIVAEAEKWIRSEDDEIKDGKVNMKGPLAGIPVSLKDSIAIAGFDNTAGYSRNAGKPCLADGTMVKILKAAGAVPHVKTALPITLLSFESSSDLFGVARNPHNPEYSPGGSSGGEGALLALGGSRIGIGSDVAGSVRVPAAWSGVYSLKCSTGRWPKGGMWTCMPGQEGVPAVFSPMARTLDDLFYFTRAMVQMELWRVDYAVHPVEWRGRDYESVVEMGEKMRKLRVGLLEADGVVRPSPAILRGLRMTAESLRKAGHTVQEIPISSLPAQATPAYGLQLGSILLNSDGCKTIGSFFRTGESWDPGAAQLSFYMSLPRPVKWLYYAYVRYVRRDTLWADLLRSFHPLTAAQNWTYVAKREAFRAAWFEWWDSPEQQFDFILCPVNATPALPHGAMRDAVASCGYTFLWNLLDYTAGVLPVTKVQKEADALEQGWAARNGVEKGAYKYYDSGKMEGLPCAVQIVGRRLQEEKVLGYMKVVEKALRADGVVYQPLEVGSP